MRRKRFEGEFYFPLLEDKDHKVNRSLRHFYSRRCSSSILRDSCALDLSKFDYKKRASNVRSNRRRMRPAAAAGEDQVGNRPAV